jgi:flagellar biosynthesis component FlhA
MEDKNLVSGNLLAFFILLVVALLIIEVPRQLLDVLIVGNLIFAISVILKALFSSSLQGLHSFPSMLVLTSLYRLALTIAITKLILLYGDQGIEIAGEVVRSFGQYASGEDPIVGAVLFLIVGLVNFLVIAKGSLRVAEVSARFTLDSLPGKQLAIDSDLRSGLISVEKASQLRKDLSLESQFYGAIDGAMKWVQGDALTSLVVAITCMITGVGLGVYRGLSFEQAINTFGLLTVGAGLVTILPSLLISVASGIIVSKVQSGESSTGEDLISHFFQDLKAPIIAGASSGVFGLLALVGLISLPAWPFLLISVLVGASIYFYRNPRTVGRNYRIFSSLNKPELLSLPDTKQISVFRLEVGDDISNYLESLAEPKSRNLDLLASYFKTISEEFSVNTGIALPELEVTKAKALSRSGYRILIRENEIIRDSLSVNYNMLDCSRSTAAALGLQVSRIDSHPLKTSQVVYISKDQKGLEGLKQIGINAYKPYQLLAISALSGILKVIEEVFGVDESKELVAKVKGSTNLAEEVFANNKVSYPEYCELLRRLVREGVNIRDQKLILEAVVEFLALREQSEDRQEWLSDLHAYVRKSLSRVILSNCLAPGDKLRVFLLAQEVEEDFRSAVKFWDGVRSLPPLSPDLEPALKESVSRVVLPMLERGALPIVVLCADDIRSAVQEFLLRNVGNGDIVKALSFDEVGSKHSSEVIGLLGLAA